MEIAVLIPCHDTSFLREALISISNQTRKPDEVVIVLNGDALNDYKDDMVTEILQANIVLKVVRSSCLGLVSALNCGLSEIQSELVARMDADDIMKSTRLELQHARFENSPNLVLLGGQMLDLESGRQIHVYPLKDRELRKSLLRFASFPHPGVMYRRSAVFKAGFYRETFPQVEDWDLWLELSRLGEIANLQDVILLYRRHDKQISNSKLSMSKTSDFNLVQERLVLGYKGKSLRLENIRVGNTITAQNLAHCRYLLSSLAGYSYVTYYRSKGILRIMHFLVIALVRPSWIANRLLKRANKF
jgi:glycosyltransferase involved in cell wall biosynthesis